MPEPRPEDISTQPAGPTRDQQSEPLARPGAKSDGIGAPRVRVILRGEGIPAREHVLDGPRDFLIGRSGKADIRLEDSRVSGRHALLTVTHAGCEVRDLNSRHGTWVNGERVESRQITSADTLQIGSTRFRAEVVGLSPLSAHARCRICGKDFAEPAPPPADMCPHCRAAEAGRDPVVPGYELVRLLGEGGQGRVHLARDVARANRLVALKTVRIPWDTAADKREHVTRLFLRESANAKELHHPNIVEFYEEGKAGEHLYFAMEYLAGGDLHDCVDHEGPLRWEVATGYMLGALAGMAEAHARKMVHRDLKPKNLLLSDAGVVKVSDLGFAKNFERAGLSGVTPSDCGPAGTLSFMAPEQVTEFKYVGPQADVWSLGATLFYLLTKRSIFESQDPPLHPLAQILRATIRPVRSLVPDLPSLIAEVVDRAISRDTSIRFDDAGVMRKALEAAVGR